MNLVSAFYGLAAVGEIPARFLVTFPKFSYRPGEVVPVWQLHGGSVFCSAKGVHVPWIMEISPTQYARMSEREKRRYDAQRNREWTDAAACKAEWAGLVREAFKLGLFTLADATRDAQDAVAEGNRQEREALRARRVDEARYENQITSPAEVEIGDRVWDVGFSQYCTVLKKFKAGLRVAGSRGNEYTAPAGRFQWLKYDDLQTVIRNGGQIDPRGEPWPGMGAW